MLITRRRACMLPGGVCGHIAHNTLPVRVCARLTRRPPRHGIHTAATHGPVDCAGLRASSPAGRTGCGGWRNAVRLTIMLIASHRDETGDNHLSPWRSDADAGARLYRKSNRHCDII